ncbi:MAG: SDR family NAD(P)-dependent oxidoreductase [Lautropia sp.]
MTPTLRLVTASIPSRAATNLVVRIDTNWVGMRTEHQGVSNSARPTLRAPRFGEAVFAQCWHFGRLFAARGRGGIVLMSSVVAFQGAPMSAHYAATKAYVQSLAEALRHELRPCGVDVIASAPGPVASGFAARARMHMARAADPEVVARETLSALGRRATVRPGGLAKLLGWSLATAPRALRVLIMGRIMGGMTVADRSVR